MHAASDGDRSVVHDIVTELCWIHVTPDGLLLTEVAEGLECGGGAAADGGETDGVS